MTMKTGFTNCRFLPNRMSAQEFWVSHQRSIITLNGSTISQIDDLSVNGDDATQSTASAQPTDDTSSLINSLRAGDYDGTTDYLISDNVASVALNPHTIIAVFHTDPGISTTDRYVWSFHQNGANREGLVVDSGGIYYWNPYTSDLDTLFSGDFRDQDLIITLLVNTTLVTPYKNGVIGSTFTTSLVSDANEFSIGQEWDSTTPSNFFAGAIGEINIHSKILSTTEREAAEAYCAGEWKISI